MKLYVAQMAPNPRRVMMFIAEKGIADLETVNVDLPSGAHKQPWYAALNPLSQVPALELDDGSVLSESRAICAYLESKYPDPNLMGADPEERAFIEMWDRRVEQGLMMPMMAWVRHTHPALTIVEPIQIPEIAAFQRAAALKFAAWLDGAMKDRAWIAGERFTVADITAICAIDFARIVKWRPDPDFPNIARWRSAMSERAAGKVAP